MRTAQVQAELLAFAPDGVDIGKTIWVGLRLQHQPHWHTYWKNAGDSGLPTQLQWTLPAGITAGDIVWPTPQKIAIGTLANFGYEGTVLLPVPLTIGSNFKPALLARDLEIGLSATWLVCRQECIPQEGRFVLQIPLRGSTALSGSEFAVAQQASPQPLPGKAQVFVSADGLRLRVTGLPAAWRGKALNAFPETSELIETAAAPASTDAVTTGTAQRQGTQAWQGEVWSAQVPLSPQRISSPHTMPWVFALHSHAATTPLNPPKASDARALSGLQAVANVLGDWPATAAPVGVSPQLQQALDANQAAHKAAPAQGGWWWALAAALMGGLILNLMPCVFPVLAIKVLAFASQGGHSKAAHKAQGLAYTAGVVLSFMALGGLMLALRAGGEQLGWGFQLQSPAVIAALAVLFTLLGLNMAGLFEVGNVLPSQLAALQLRHPTVDAFLSGVLVVAIASPCTAPFMGASLGYAITLPAAQALGIFAALGLGLALPYLLASWVPAVGRYLPRPGVWMLQLRHFMAFLMWATVVWLLWVLGHLSGVDGAASLLALLLALSLVVWALGLQGRSRWVFTTVSIATCAALTGALGHNVLKIEPLADAAATAATATATASPDGTPHWQPWTPGRVQAELAAGKTVFVDFTAAWCITCQLNKKTTLTHPDVLAQFQSHQVTLLRADWTRRDPAITLALEQLGRSGVPVYVLYKPGHAPVVLSEILSVQEVLDALPAVPVLNAK